MILCYLGQTCHVEIPDRKRSLRPLELHGGARDLADEGPDKGDVRRRLRVVQQQASCICEGPDRKHGRAAPRCHQELGAEQLYAGVVAAGHEGRLEGQSGQVIPAPCPGEASNGRSGEDGQVRAGGSWGEDDLLRPSLEPEKGPGHEHLLGEAGVAKQGDHSLHLECRVLGEIESGLGITPDGTWATISHLKRAKSHLEHRRVECLEDREAVVKVCGRCVAKRRVHAWIRRVTCVIQVPDSHS